MGRQVDGRSKTYGVQKRVSANFGAASTRVMNVVAFHGDEVVAAGQVDGPVMV